MFRIKNGLTALAAVLLVGASVALATTPASPDPFVAERVRKELVKLPYYGVFDNIAFSFNGDVVTLYGQVVRPTTRKDAERRVAKVRGVDHVINRIDVLPLSRFDDGIRLRTYRAVFGTGGLHRYARGVNPSIHIVVDRGHVTLEGVVDNASDRNLAYIAARGVPGAFSVTNNLRVARKNS